MKNSVIDDEKDRLKRIFYKRDLQLVFLFLSLNTESGPDAGAETGGNKLVYTT